MAAETKGLVALVEEFCGENFTAIVGTDARGAYIYHRLAYDANRDEIAAITGKYFSECGGTECYVLRTGARGKVVQMNMFGQKGEIIIIKPVGKVSRGHEEE